MTKSSSLPDDITDPNKFPRYKSLDEIGDTWLQCVQNDSAERKYPDFGLSLYVNFEHESVILEQEPESRIVMAPKNLMVLDDDKIWPRIWPRCILQMQWNADDDLSAEVTEEEIRVPETGTDPNEFFKTIYISICTPRDNVTFTGMDDKTRNILRDAWELAWIMADRRNLEQVAMQKMNRRHHGLYLPIDSISEKLQTSDKYTRDSKGFWVELPAKDAPAGKTPLASKEEKHS